MKNNPVKIKIGLVGFGKHSSKIWLPILLANENFLLSAISSENVDSFAVKSEIDRLSGGSHPPIEFFSDHNSLLKSNSLDCVLIATSNNKHGEQVISALKSKKHVLCEKPLGFLEEDSKTILEIFKSSEDLILETGFMYRFHPQWLFAKDYFDRIRNENWMIHGQFQYNISNKSNYRNYLNCGGGALLDEGCYFLDICELFKINAPKTCQVTSDLADSGVDENTTIDLRFAEGQRASFHCSIKQVRFQSFSIFGENSYIQLESPFIVAKNKKALLIERNEIGKIKQHFFEFSDCYKLELENFADLINNKSASGFRNNGVNNAKWLSELIRTR